ncbi:MAG TPA: hypothetical protein PLP57_08100 [Candidatus Saccharicenans sp.]|mgnify:CR=1 FL=1|jgi:hypothetical protein|nr:hypothetical protein [Candidatus Saccharicenans sp.]HRD02586.1 hypothetical protein [Candidatus Saccharicenans sp.]
MNQVNIFISHASDADCECQSIKEIINEETKNHFSTHGYNFKPICWKDLMPGIGKPQEEKIDPEIIDQNCKLVILILKNSLGTRKKDNKTGIEHEYDLAKYLSKEIMIYRCDFLIRPSQIEPQQLLETNEFISIAKTEGLIVERISLMDELGRIFRSNFSQWAQKLINSRQNISEFNRYNRGF